MYFWELLATLFLHQCSLKCTGMLLLYYLLLGNEGLEILIVGLLSMNRKLLSNLEDMSQIGMFIKKNMIDTLDNSSFSQIIDPQLILNFQKHSYFC